MTASFQLPAAPLHSSPSREYYLSKRSATGGDGNAGGDVFNEKAILGETLDVNLSDGTYSWSNPASIPKDDTRSPTQQSKSSSARAASNEKDSYKRIAFDGCGSILIHQQPKDFVEPNISSQTDEEKNELRRRRQGRTGVTLWSASYMISYYIDAQWSKGGYWHSDKIGMGSKPQNAKWTVLELGAGLGLCSAVATKYGMNVVSTDNDPVAIQLLKENLERNAPVLDQHTERQQQISVHPLDWVAVANDNQAETCHPVFLQLESLGGTDLILLSDAIYGATQPAWESLLILLNKFCAQRQRLFSERVDEDSGSLLATEEDITQSDSTACPIVLLGYTQRRRDMSPQDEARFFAVVKAAGMEAVLIPSTSIPKICEKYMLTSLFELRWIG